METTEYRRPQTSVFVPLPTAKPTDEIDLVSNDKYYAALWAFAVNNIVPIESPMTTMSGGSWFQTLRAEWHKQRGAASSITRIAMCPAYQNIIALGPQIIPHILRQLESEGDEPDMWFWALNSLTQGYDPVPESDRGDFRAMANSWLNWGRRRYAW